MDVVIAGGHGQIALLLAPLLAERGDRVRGLIRNPDHEQDVRVAGAEPVICDLEKSGVDDLRELVAGADAIVFAAGAGPGSGAARKDTLDRDAAIKLMDTGVERYVMVSAISAKPPMPDGDEVYDVYVRAKFAADEALRASALRYTIVRPGGLTDDSPTGRVSVAPELERGQVTRADVAAVVAATLLTDATVGLTFDLVGGETPIDDALAALAAEGT